MGLYLPRRMSLADEIRRLETLLEQGELASADFEAQVAALIQAASLSTDTTARGGAQAARAPGSAGSPTPTHIGAYELVELLGQGGMGAVYLAKHLLKPGLFAVKVPRYELLTQPGFGLRFKREASVGLKLSHRGIVRVHDLVIDGDWAAIVMDFVAGPNLETLLRNQGGPLPLPRVLDVMVQVLDAMEYAHGQGVVHRDLKPKNIIVRPGGQVQVTDFGIAWLLGTDEAEAGAFIGTAAYVAPELFSGIGQADPRVDVYALGMTLYKLLVGHLPFQRDLATWELRRQKEEGRVPVPAEIEEALPAGLVGVLDRATQPDPARRFQSCFEFREALVAAVPGSLAPRDAREETPPPPPPARASPDRGGFQYVMLVVLVALLGAVVWLGLAIRRQQVTDLGGPWEEGLDGTRGVRAGGPRSSPSPPAEAAGPGTGAAGTTPGKAGSGMPGEHGSEPGGQGPTPGPDGTSPPPAPSAQLGRPSPTPRPEGTTTDPARASPAPTRVPATASPSPLASTGPSTPEPSPAAADEMGLLFLVTRPRSQVEIEGHSYSSDQTRMGLVMAPGRYRARFVCDDPACEGFERRSGVKTLQVVAGQETRFVVDFWDLNDAAEPAPGDRQR